MDTSSHRYNLIDPMSFDRSGKSYSKTVTMQSNPLVRIAFASPYTSFHGVERSGLRGRGSTVNLYRLGLFKRLDLGTTFLTTSAVLSIPWGAIFAFLVHWLRLSQLSGDGSYEAWILRGPTSSLTHRIREAWTE